MAVLSLRDRLQPALLDRLIDDERLVTVFYVSVRRDELQRLGLAVERARGHPGGPGAARAIGPRARLVPAGGRMGSSRCA